NPDFSESHLKLLVEENGATQEDLIPQIDVRILRVPAENLDHVLAALQHNPNIEFAEPDFLVEPSVTPNDPQYPSQWHLPIMQCPNAWGITFGNTAVTIAICDSGVDATHPDLAANIVPGWNFFSSNSITTDV